jgi:hypothetical protein
MAALTDWITLDEAKAAVNITGSTFDTEVALYVSAASQRLDQLAGAAVIRTVTGEVHNVSGAGITSILLNYRPVVAATSVVEHNQTTARTLTLETNSAKTASDYLLDLAEGRLRRRTSGYDSPFPAGRGNVVITYTAGRFATTAVVAERFKLAASIYLSHLWKREQGAGTVTFGGPETDAALIPTFGIPNVVRDLLLDEISSVLVA